MNTRCRLLFLLLPLVIVAGCSRSSIPGESEEKATDREDVPVVVLDAANEICARLGGARCGNWFWDMEDHCWEVALFGLSRRAELDLGTDGAFLELELVYAFAEVAHALPDVAETVRSKCRSDSGTFIELSLRREEYLDAVPELRDAWEKSGVVLEFQCANGSDFELDSRGMVIMKKVDDTADPTRGGDASQ